MISVDDVKVRIEDGFHLVKSRHELPVFRTARLKVVDEQDVPSRIPYRPLPQPS